MYVNNWLHKKKRNIGNDDDGTKLFDANFLHRQKLSSPLINVASRWIDV